MYIYVHIPNLVFNFLKHYRRPRTPLIRPSVRPSVCLSQNQPEGSNNRLAKAEGRRPDALPAGLVGFSAGRRLQKLSSAPRALAHLQYTLYVIQDPGPWIHVTVYTDPYPVPHETTNTVYH